MYHRGMVRCDPSVKRVSCRVVQSARFDARVVRADDAGHGADAWQFRSVPHAAGRRSSEPELILYSMSAKGLRVVSYTQQAGVNMDCMA